MTCFPGNGSTESKTDEENKVRIKVVQLAMLQKQVNDQQEESDGMLLHPISCYQMRANEYDLS